MWSYEQNSSYQAVAIRDGATLQETFRKKIYDKDKARGILSNNLTINEKFYGRVNITDDGNLILMNSIVQDSGNYKCSYQGITGPVEESLLKLSVKPFKGRTNLSFVITVWQCKLERKWTDMLIIQSLQIINQSINQSINHSMVTWFRHILKNIDQDSRHKNWKYNWIPNHPEHLNCKIKKKQIVCSM